MFSNLPGPTQYWLGDPSLVLVLIYTKPRQQLGALVGVAVVMIPRT